MISQTGVAAMAAGLSIVAYEVSTRFVHSRLGGVGHVVVVGCGIYFSIWGLKEIIAGLFPSLGKSSLGRDRFVFPAEGLVYVGIMMAVFAGAMIGRSNPLMLVFSLMAGPLVVNGWVTKTLLYRVTPVRRVPARLMAGEPASVEITLTNGKHWLSAWLLIAVDRIASEQEELQPRAVFPRVPPGQQTTSHYRIRLARRGVHRLGPLQVNTRFPLGLVERGLHFDLPDRILVYPRLGRMTSGWKSRLREALELSQQQAAHSGSFNDEFHKLRDYRRGDDQRAIHWKTSARQNELMVREFRQNRDQDLVLLLDAWTPPAPTPEDQLAVEQAVSLAASIAADQCRHGRESVPFFVAAGLHETFTWGGTQGSHRLETLLDHLALLEPSAQQPLDERLELCRGQLRHSQRLLIVTSRSSDVRPLVESWVAERPVERGRLLRSLDVLNARDPQTARLIVWT